MDFYIYLIMKNKYVNAHNVVQIKEKMNARETRLEREALYFIRMIHKMEKQMSFQLKKPFSKFACPKAYAAFSTLDAGIAQTSSFFLSLHYHGDKTTAFAI